MKLITCLILIFFVWFNSFAADYSVQFKEAENIFNSPNQGQSIPLLEKLILALETTARERDLANEERLLLIRSYDMLGQALFNNNDESNARSSFLKLIEWNADYKMNTELVSPKIIDVLDEIKRDNLAMLTVRSTPEGALVYLDGRSFGATNFENESVVKGKHKLEIRLKGYQPVSRDIDIPVGAMQEITVQLAKDTPSS